MSRCSIVASAFCISAAGAENQADSISASHVEVHAHARPQIESKHVERIIVQADGQTPDAAAPARSSSLSDLKDHNDKEHHDHHHQHAASTKTSLASPHIEPNIELDSTSAHAKIAHKQQHHEHSHAAMKTHSKSHEHGGHAQGVYTHQHQQHVKLHQNDPSEKLINNDDDPDPNPEHDEREDDDTDNSDEDPYGDADPEDDENYVNEDSDDEDHDDSDGSTAADADENEEERGNSTIFNDPLNVKPWDTQTSSTFVPLELWLRLLITVFLFGLGAFCTWWTYKQAKNWASAVGVLWGVGLLVWIIFAFVITRQEVDDETIAMMNQSLGPEASKMVAQYQNFFNQVSFF